MIALIHPAILIITLLRVAGQAAARCSRFFQGIDLFNSQDVLSKGHQAVAWRSLPRLRFLGGTETSCYYADDYHLHYYSTPRLPAWVVPANPGTFVSSEMVLGEIKPRAWWIVDEPF
ncbi:hypothetical protein FRB94_013188 [Tulasnella sp. JGI-2019a]|nr:hypothetical protein FRB94_013188 [Tulasnella sp. JGI-2019a]